MLNLSILLLARIGSCNQIRNSIPIIRTRNELILLLGFIGKPKKIDTYRLLGEWVPNDRQRLLENTRWWLYDYQEYLDEKGELITGITRSIIYFNTFGNLSIDTIDLSKGSKDVKGEYKGVKGEYIGAYKIYGPTSTHLLVEAHLANDRARDLHILLDISDEDFFANQIALGQYHNIARGSIYSGTVIMERFLEQGSKKADFFKKDDAKIEKVYWEFFEDKYKNRIRTKANIKTKVELKKWIDSKRGS